MTHSTQPPTDPAAEDDFVLLNDLLDGRLDEAAGADVRARIEADSVLAELYEELLGVRACVRAYGPAGADLEPPPDFLEHVRAAVAAAAQSGRSREASAARETPRSAAARPRGRMLRMFAIAYAAAALLVVGFSVHYLLRDRRPAAGRDNLETAAARPAEPAVRDARTSPRPAPDGDAEASAGAKDLVDAETERLARLRLEEAREAEKKAEPVLPGAFGGPGGAAPPGIRAPSDEVPAERPAAGRLAGGHRPSPTPPPIAPTTPPGDAPPSVPEPAEAGEPADLLSSGEIVYVFVAQDAAGARRELERLLARLDADLPATRDKGEDKEGKRRAAPGSARLYKVTDRREVSRLLAARLEVGGTARADAAGEAKGGAGAGTAKSLEPEHTVIDTVVRKLDPAAWRRLESLVAEATWPRAQALPKRAPADGADDRGAPEESEASPPAKGQPPGAKGKAKEAGPPHAPAPAPAPAPATPAEHNVRVRILILHER